MNSTFHCTLSSVYERVLYCSTGSWNSSRIDSIAKCNKIVIRDENQTGRKAKLLELFCCVYTECLNVRGLELRQVRRLIFGHNAEETLDVD